MAELVPWDEIATVFLRSMSAREGRPSVDLCPILGTLLVKYTKNLSGERTFEYIYARYFAEPISFQTAPVFVVHILLPQAGGNDKCTPYWQILEYVAKLRNHTRSDEPILLYTAPRGTHPGTPFGPGQKQLTEQLGFFTYVG